MGTYFDNFIVAVQPHAAFPHAPRSDRTIIRNRGWMQGFRDRWNICLGKVASRDMVSPTEIAEKVSIREAVKARFFVISMKMLKYSILYLLNCFFKRKSNKISAASKGDI